MQFLGDESLSMGSPIPWVSYSIILLLLLLYGSGRGNIDCSFQGLRNQLWFGLIHGNALHLIVNVWSFYQFSYLETILGSRNYLILILSIWVLSSVIYWLINLNLVTLFTGPLCSVGFSGVILGLLIWSRMMFRNDAFDLREIWLWFLILFVPVIQNPRISLLGHLSGILAGILLRYFPGNYLVLQQ